MSKIVIVGCGNVGMSYAYLVATTKNRVNELVLIDINKNKALGEAKDLTHASVYKSENISIKSGDYNDCDNADIIVIAAGRNQDVGETRRDLIHKNYEVFKQIITCVNKTKFNGIYLVATNPLDVMTSIVKKLSNFPASKVLGSGTTLDSARLKSLIGKQLGINPKSVHACVIGEHGDSEFIPWSNAMIGLNNIDVYLSEEQRENLLDDVRTSAYDIINKKGNTCYGIGMCLLEITNAILDDSNLMMTVSAYNSKHDIYFGMPSILNSSGVKDTPFLELNKKEEKMLEFSIKEIKECLKDIIDD